MRLKKLIVHGFKSFADRTEFVFDAPITGVVGPNGCGKSNVVDAVKWVLGEQSAKSLRGEAMLDVIFNGSSARKPAGVAEVTLVFENPRRDDGTRPLQLDTDEVGVGRRLYRDGTSEYLLNGQVARLKDVRDLFLDTGIGVDAYSVIEQGRVAQMLDASSEERRVIFEEAAGISRFKVKKKEAQRKLEKVEQNLLRLNDIVEEVERRLRSVKIQAGKARSYQELTARLNELRLGYSLHEYHGLATREHSLAGEQEQWRFALDDAAGDLQGRQNRLAERRQSLDAVQQARQRVEHELLQAEAQIEQARQQQRYAQQQLQQLAEQSASLERDARHSASRLEETRRQSAAERQSLERLSEELQQQRAAIEVAEREHRDAQLALGELQRQTERDKSAILETMRTLAGVQSRLSAIESERRNHQQQRERLEVRRKEVSGQIENASRARDELAAAIRETEAELSSRQEQLEAQKQAAASLGERIKELSERLGAAKEQRSALASRQRLLQDLEQRREGVSDAVKAVLRQREQVFPFVRGLVADALRVDVEHAPVIEAALDGRDQWLVVDRLEQVREHHDAIGRLSGRVNFACRHNGHHPREHHDWNRHSVGVRLAIDLIRFEAEDEPLAVAMLGRTAIVDSLDDAIALHREGPSGWRYVTRAREVVEADGTVRAGPLTASMSLLSRRSELDSIAAHLVDLDARIEELSSHLSQSNVQARAVEELTNALRNELYQCNARKVELVSKLNGAVDQLQQLQREQPLLERELSALEQHVGKLDAEAESLRESRGGLERRQSELQERVQQATARQSEMTDAIARSGEALTALRVAAGQVQEKQLAAEQSVRRLHLSEQELSGHVERLQRSLQQLEARRGQVASELLESERLERTLSETADAARTRAEELRREVEGLQQEVQSLDREVASLRERHAEIEQSLHRLDVQLSELRVRLQALVQRTREELQLDLPARYAEVCAASSEGYQPGSTDWDAVAEEIRETRERIQRLGNVNLDALAELDDLEKRQQHYATQLQDLHASRGQLCELIDQINAESSVRFEQTFTAVREHFQTMFRKLFGGGKADICLETSVEESAPANPDGTPGAVMRRTVDPLEAGIEIFAHPPGKKPATISQLSGGEKTMTCIALLMSIFKAKPSPFCILDEVDAALDEANNQRFNLIVQEFLEQSQFIIITHSKATMQIADVLYGVTMQEQGVSTRVAVKFDQVDQSGRFQSEAVVAA